MLKQFSNKLKKYPKIFVLTLILVFLVPFLLIDILAGNEGSYSTSKNVDVGKIQGEIISSQKYFELYKKALIVTIVQGGDTRIFSKPKNRVVKEFILRKEYALKVTGISQLAENISNEKYLERVKNTSFFKKLKTIDKANLEHWKERLVMTNRQINIAFKEQALLDVVLAEYKININEEEIITTYKEKNTKIDMGYQIFRTKDFQEEFLRNKFDTLGLIGEFDHLKVLKALYDEQARILFNNNPSKYEIPAEVSLNKINFDYKKIAKIVKVTDAEIRAFYDKKNDYKQTQYKYISFFPIIKLNEQNKEEFDSRVQGFYKKYQKGLSKEELDEEVKKYSKEYKIAILFENNWQSENSLNRQILGHLKSLKLQELKFFTINSNYYGFVFTKLRKFIPFDEVKLNIETYLKETKGLRLAEQKSSELYDKISNFSMGEVQKFILVKNPHYTIDVMPSFKKTAAMERQISFNLKIPVDSSLNLDANKAVSKQVFLANNQIALVVVSDYIPKKKQNYEQLSTQIFSKLLFDDVQKYIKEKIVSKVEGLKKNYEELVNKRAFYTKVYLPLVLPIAELLPELKSIIEDKVIILSNNTEGIRIYVFREKQEPNLNLEKTQFEKFKKNYTNNKREEAFIKKNLSKIKEELEIY